MNKDEVAGKLSKVDKLMDELIFAFMQTGGSFPPFESGPQSDQKSNHPKSRLNASNSSNAFIQATRLLTSNKLPLQLGNQDVTGT
jgi:hypothetical protein